MLVLDSSHYARRDGFTLLEALAAILILGVVVMPMVDSYLQAVRLRNSSAQFWKDYDSKNLNSLPSFKCGTDIHRNVTTLSCGSVASELTTYIIK